MNLWEVLIVSVGLSLDAFTIAVCRGSTQRNLKKSTAILVGLIFGAIQTIMLAAGMIIAIYPMLNIQNEKIRLFNLIIHSINAEYSDFFGIHLLFQHLKFFSIPFL